MASAPDNQSRGKGGRGFQGACPLTKYEAAPHARVSALLPPCRSLSLRCESLLGLRSARCLPRLCRHASIRTLITAFAAGACWCSQFKGVLPSLYRPAGKKLPASRRSAALTQSPQPGASAYFAEPNPSSILMPQPWLCSRLCSWPLRPPCGCSADRRPLPSPTTDAATPPASARSPQSSSSWLSC
jgi:hypothetical protein